MHVAVDLDKQNAFFDGLSRCSIVIKTGYFLTHLP